MFRCKFITSKVDRTIELYLRFLGVDFSLVLYGWLSDWVFPFSFIPTLRGFFAQTLGVALFIGRLAGDRT